MQRTVRDALINALEELERERLKRFKGKLTDLDIEEDYSKIPRGRLENAEVDKIVDIIRDFYGDSYGCKLTLDVLYCINERQVENNLRKDLDKIQRPTFAKLSSVQNNVKMLLYQVIYLLLSSGNTYLNLRVHFSSQHQKNKGLHHSNAVKEWKEEKTTQTDPDCLKECKVEKTTQTDPDCLKECMVEKTTQTDPDCYSELHLDQEERNGQKSESDLSDEDIIAATQHIIAATQHSPRPVLGLGLGLGSFYQRLGSFYQPIEEARKLKEEVLDKSQQHFVMKHRGKLIEKIHPIGPVLDDLLKKEYLTTEQRNVVLSKPTPEDKMRALYEYVRCWGEKDQEEFCEVLKKRHPKIIRDLENKI